MINVATIDETTNRTDLADWLELLLLSQQHKVVSSALVIKTLGIVADEPEYGTLFDEDSEELVDEEILEPKVEQLLAELWQELNYRANYLNDGYPFLLTPHGQGFILEFHEFPTDEAVRSARLTYCSCLLMSAWRGAALSYSASFQAGKALEKHMSRIMQILAVKAAAHLVCGDAYWFGWPRISNASSYQDALQELVGLLGHGRLKAKSPAWSKGATKDGTVDVVAWRSHPDRSYGSVLLYGQVASGKNWRSKSVVTYLNSHFHDWFEDDPAKHYLPAMFMPFMLHADARARRSDTYEEALEGIARREEAAYGIVVDRLRATVLNRVDERNSCPTDASHMSQHEALTSEIVQWLVEVQAGLLGVSAS